MTFKMTRAGLLVWTSAFIGLASGLQLGLVTINTDVRNRCSTSLLVLKMGAREEEIKRKIMQLKRQGKLNKPPDIATSSLSYEDKVRNKLGSKKSSLLDFGDSEGGSGEVANIQEEIDSLEEYELEGEPLADQTVAEEPRGRIGLLPRDQGQSKQAAGMQPSALYASRISIDPSLFKEEVADSPEMSEEELVELVEAKLAEKQRKDAQEAAEILANTPRVEPPNNPKPTTTTSGVGGTWQKAGNSTPTDLYKPKSGSWGAFPRPKDISKAYGGGRRVGAGFSKEDDMVADMNTQKLLQEYRRKAGIDVPSEKEHADQIAEALRIAQLAMERGVYATAVSALEKVTQWCSTNSKVGSKVFLELAMAYEASGRTQEAYQVYKTLTTCRMEDVKFNARRLLYGLEAMEFMKDVSSDFSRKKIKSTFIDATHFGQDFIQNFDDVYRTGYIDTENGFYKKLTESVVRSNREARQILLKATGKGEVGRLKVIQALRSMARHFDDALERETRSQINQEPTAYINGQPIVAGQPKCELGRSETTLDEFVLMSPEQMMENLDGTWKLQLLADKQGDGVSFFNTTSAVQEFSTMQMTFTATGPSGLAKVKCSGKLQLQGERRILVREDVKTESTAGSIFGMFGSTKNSGFLAAVSQPQQIMTVDSTLLITKIPAEVKKGKDSEKEHFAVWRRTDAR